MSYIPLPDNKIPELEDFPEIDVQAVEKYANSLFKPYLFFRRTAEGIELRASCCNKKGFQPVPARTMGETEYSLITGKHNDNIICPYCGRNVTYKEISRLGKKIKLLEYNPVVVLSERDGDIFARAYWTLKDYQGALEAPPLFALVECYHFTHGKATGWFHSYNDKLIPYSIAGNYDPVHRVVKEPFIEGNWIYYRYIPYSVFNIEALDKSKFQYCCYEEFRKKYFSHYRTDKASHTDMMKYLAAYSIYPRQIEMLMKNGYESIVCDLIIGRCKNAAIINWNEENPFKAFDLSKEELREFRNSKASVYSIRWYKYLRKAGLTTSFEDLNGLHQELIGDEEAFFRICRKYKIKPLAAIRYLNSFTRKKRGTDMIFSQWKDYLSFAKLLGWDLKEKTVAMPKDLSAKHDQAAEEVVLKKAITDEHKNAAALAAALQSISLRKKKYNIKAEGYFIRVAEDSEEILREGKRLQHCVGGYAQRHMAGKTTILFLRRVETPKASLYTIEMDVNRLIQIHGYKNEGYPGAKSPLIEMAWLINPWLDWLKKGSKRNKDGSPKIKIKKETELEVKTA